MTGFTGRGRFERHIKIERGQAGQANDGLRFLWARERVRLLSDFRVVDGGEAGRVALTELGLRYNLLTEFTSFVAIDQRMRRTDGTFETVKQPLPLPQGVSDLAIGGPEGRAAESMMVAARTPVNAATDKALLGGRPANQVATPAAPPPTPLPTPLSARVEPVSALRVNIVETRLKNRGPADAAALGRTLTSAIRVGRLRDRCSGPAPEPRDDSSMPGAVRPGWRCSTRSRRGHACAASLPRRRDSPRPGAGRAGRGLCRLRRGTRSLRRAARALPWTLFRGVRATPHV